METILASSGYLPETMRELNRRWHVVDIPDQQEALAWLEECAELPAALAIGHVGPGRSSKARAVPARVMLEAAHRIDPQLPVVISTGEGRSAAIVEYVKLGAFDYVVEPGRAADDEAVTAYTGALVLALERAAQWRLTVLENRRLRERLAEEAGAAPFLTRSPRMRRLLDMAQKVASTRATVLITGESGTGKELVAQRIHSLSDRAREPFVALNCASLNETLLTSELFGHVKGAFTGADRPKPGLIRDAGAGTLFLDEISAVSTGFQALLLRVLEQRKARPVGGGPEYHVECRFVAAANRDLSALVKSGTFREDLFYRLNVFPLHLPPLRRRTEDIPMLAQHFLLHAAEEFGRTVSGFEPDALRRLETFAWPGNIRELRNVVERAVILATGPRIRNAEIAEALPESGDELAHPDAPTDYARAMRDFEARFLQRALRESGGSVSLAARRLNMKRTTLAYRLKRRLG